MSQVITNAFEQYWQSSLAAEQPVVLDEFILADIPNLDITAPIDPDTVLPPESQIVHRQNVDQRGRVNNNAVAYTIVMDTTIGDFSFNAMYLRNKQNGVIGMIVYKGRETKLKTDQTTGQTGNSLVKSMLMGYDQAAEATLTHVDAGTWQIDYAARLRGMDEDIRQLQADLYGHHTFIGDGFKVVEKNGAYQVTKGVAIVGGLRVELKQPEVIYPGTKPIGVWVDVHRAGSLLSEHQNHFTIVTSVADLADHVDSNGYQHYVAKLGTVQNNGTIEDGRGTTGSGGAGVITDTFALWKRAMAEAGFDLLGKFGEEHTIQHAKQALLIKKNDVVMCYLGQYPKHVEKDYDPFSSGEPEKWKVINDETLANVLASKSGASEVKTSSGKSVQSELDKLKGMFGVSVNIADYASLKDAIAALPVFGGTVYVPIGRYYAGDWNYNIDYMKKPNISLVGQKKPTWNDDASALVGGSVIYGRFNCFADNFSVVDVGFDMGKQVIDEFYSGASTLSANYPQGGTWDAFAFAQPNMSAPLRQRRGFSAKGVIALCKESNTVGHAFLAEGFNGGFLDDIIGIYSIHAVVIKAQNVRGGTVSGFMASVDNVIFKSDTYAPGGDIQLNAVLGDRTLPNCTPHSAPVIANYGLYFHPATANFTGPIQVGSVTCKGSSHGVAGNTLTGVDIQLGQVIVDGNTGQMLYGVDFGSTGKFRRITIGSLICNNVVDALYVKHAADPTTTDPQVHIGSMHVTHASGIAITAAESAVITVDSLELKKVAMAYNFASKQAKIRVGAARMNEVQYVFQNPITLNAGWSNYGAGNSSFGVFLHDYGVKVKGLLIAGAGATSTISPLLESIRPQENLRFPSYKRVAGSGAFSLVGVDAVNGLLVDDGAAPTTGSLYSMDGISWDL